MVVILGEYAKVYIIDYTKYRIFEVTLVAAINAEMQSFFFIYLLALKYRVEIIDQGFSSHCYIEPKI